MYLVSIKNESGKIGGGIVFFCDFFFLGCIFQIKNSSFLLFFVVFLKCIYRFFLDFLKFLWHSFVNMGNNLIRIFQLLVVVGC
jgi:hypothetical protein